MNMTVMIYTKEEKEYSDYGDTYSRVSKQVLLITDPVIQAKQVFEMVQEIMYEESPREWNDMGYEVMVEPSYAKGCMYQQKLALQVKPLLKAYQLPSDLSCLLPSMPYDNTLQRRLDCFSQSDFGGDAQERAHRELPDHEQALDMMESALSEIVPRYAHTWKMHRDNLMRTYSTTYTIQFIPLDESHFNSEAFDSVNKTNGMLIEERQVREMDEYEAHMKTDAYKKEQKEEAQRKSDLATYMGENGFNSYADNGDGTISTWRE